MLAPPRGYAGGVQQSIWQAFGYRDKEQALCRPIATAYAALPKDVVQRILSMTGNRRLSRRHSALL